MNSKLSLFLACLLLILIGCKKETNNENSTPVNFSGNWIGTWKSTSYNMTGSFTVNVTQKQGTLSGTISVPDIEMQNATLTGTVNGSNISFGDVNNTISFTGKLTNDSTASGNYVYPGQSDKGTWQANKLGNNPASNTIIYPLDTIATTLRTAWLIGAAFDGTYYYAMYNNYIYKINNNGQTIDSLNSPVSHAMGLTYDGSHLLLADDPAYGTGVIYKLSGLEKIALKAPGYGDILGSVVIGNDLWQLDDINKRIYKQSLINGNLTDSISINTNFNKGLTYDGQNLWYYSNDTINKIDLSGNILRKIEYTMSPPSGLTFLQNYLWIADSYNQKIYKTDTGLNLVATLNSPITNLANITSDGTNLWILQSGIMLGYVKAYKISTSGSIISSIDMPFDRDDVGGLAFGNNYLWYDVIVQNMIYKIDPSGSSCFTIPGQFSLLTFDGTNCWGYNSSKGTILKFSTTGELLQNNAISISSATGMTWDGNNIWILTDNSMESTMKLNKLDASGNIIKTIQVFRPIVTIHNSYGISSYGILYHDNAFWILGSGPFFDAIKIYKYSL